MTLFESVETWDDKMRRLATELAQFRTETYFIPADDKRWSKFGPRFRALRWEIDQHLREVPR